MITNRIKFITQHAKKTTVLALALAMAFALSAVVSAQDTQFKLAPREQLAKFHEAQFERFYDRVPADVLQKHGATIAKIDKKIKDEKLAGAITSQASQFDLSYYADTIMIGILPYIDNNDPFSKELQELANDIAKYTIDYKRLKEFNKAHFGDTMPAPTIQGESKERDMARISLNGSGYNTVNAVNYARAWTQNGTVTRNPQYSFYNGKNDCTNFVSQVLKAGGLSYVRIDHFGWDHDDPDNWYYANSYLNPPSWTWGGAHNQYWHLKNWSSNVRRVYSTGDLRVGDVVMWDIFPNDGTFHIGHNTVVTKIQSGIIYVTYHSNDREDEPISTLFNKGYLAYGWAINH
ncbi:MAG: amidase domain-containing protein [Patescibacteria group bacterium]